MLQPRTYATAVALAAAGALAGCGGSGPAATTAGTPAGPAGTTAAVQPATTAPGTATTSAAVKAAAIARIAVRNGEPVGGVKTVTVKKDDRVRIVVTVDAPQELHLHGYDIEREAAPGTPAVFDFVAKYEGIWDLESHATDAQLVKLVVEP